MSDSAKSNLKKLIVAAVVALAGAGGADAAGITFDVELAKQLGLGGGLILVVYLHLQIRPVIVAGAADLAWLRRRLGGESATDVDAELGIGRDPVMTEPTVIPTPTPRPAVALVRAPTSDES